MSSVLGATPLDLPLISRVSLCGIRLVTQLSAPIVKSIHCYSKADLLVLHSFFSLELLALVPVLNSWVEIMSWVGVLQTCSLRPKLLGMLPKVLGNLPKLLGMFPKLLGVFQYS